VADAFTIAGQVWADRCEKTGEWQEVPGTPPPGCIVAPKGSFFVANGVLDPGETGRPGMLVQVTAGTCVAPRPRPGKVPDASLPVSGTVHTNAAGRFVFNGLPAGTYCLSASQPGNAAAARGRSAGSQGIWTFPLLVLDAEIAQAAVVLPAGPTGARQDFGWDDWNGPKLIVPATAQPDTQQR
jgi:hypothetical protein